MQILLYEINVKQKYNNYGNIIPYFCNVNNVPVMCLHLLTRFSSLEGSSFKNLKEKYLLHQWAEFQVQKSRLIL